MQVKHFHNEPLNSLYNDIKICIKVAHWCKMRILPTKQFVILYNLDYKGIPK
jgi:hypothetical protein